MAKKANTRKPQARKGVTAAKSSSGGASRATKTKAAKAAKSPAKAARKPAGGTTRAAKGTKKPKSAATRAVKPAKASGSAKATKKAKKTARPAAKKSVATKATTRKAPAGKSVKSKASKRKGSGLHSALTQAEMKEFRKLLLAKRRELVGDMTGIEAEALGADREESKGDISDHPADAGTDNFEQEFSLGLLESERNMLAEIDQALARIDRGTYGICVGTGNPISKARLSARPWAPYGIEYARMVEKGLIRPGEKVVSEFPEDDDDDDDDDGDEDYDEEYEPEDGNVDDDGED